VENMQESWAEEKQSAYLYHVMAEVEAGSPREKLFRELATAAERQPEYGGTRSMQPATDTDLVLPLRARVVAKLIRTIGPRSMKPVLAAMKVRGISVYDHTSMPPTTQNHPKGGVGAAT